MRFVLLNIYLYVESVVDHCLFICLFFVQIFLKRISMILLAEKWTYKISWSFSSVQRLEVGGSCSFQWYWSLFRLSFRDMYIIVGICCSNYQLIVLTSSICCSCFLLPLFLFLFSMFVYLVFCILIFTFIKQVMF